jgi:2-polyprenyl-3-methyl-5-hydroxy-6-metoxy-1,4-benzoquinol methylase
MNLKKHKLNIMKKSDYYNIAEKYDFIFFNHTLEHISDFDTFYENVKILMHSDSLLYIEVPDINRISSKKDYFLEITYEHINFFNINSLNNLSLKYDLINISSGILDFRESWQRY